jgi:release factor glutamine methyltransferase
VPDTTLRIPYFDFVTVLEVIQRSSEFLGRKGVESPRLQIELLLSHLLQMPRLKLYLNFERVLTEAELEKLRLLVKRRGEREPLQQILGTTSFCGHEISVTRDVLIPRPETEQLAEKAWQHLQKLNVAKVLDYGTGSGCLAITIALKCPQAEVHAVDISKPALEMAQKNANRLQAKVQFHLGDAFSVFSGDCQFNLIVGNPPYIPTSDIAQLQPEVRDFDPRGALDGGPDGLAFYRRLVTEAPQHLAPGGTIMLEFGDGQEQALEQLFSAAPWQFEAICPDLSGRPRILIAHRAKS